MNYISTTELRTKSPELIKTLRSGAEVSLIHRSKVIGIIKPAHYTLASPIDIKKFRRVLAALRPKKLIPRSQREKIYREHLLKKYGKNLSRRK